MSQLAASDGQPGNWEEPGFFLRRLETVRSQEKGWQEPCESRGSRTDLWERGGEIPPRHPTLTRPSSVICSQCLPFQFYPLTPIPSYT
jgi:hypothetical protein